MENELVKGCRVCPVCGFEFEPDEKNRVYCCKACRSITVKKLKAAVLKWKGKIEKVKPAITKKEKPKFVSKIAEPVVCSICGKEFVRKVNSQKTCSISCSEKLTRERMKKYRIKRGLPVLPDLVKCLICGKEFQPGRNTHKTCSPECARKFKNQRDKERKKSYPAKICPECGIEFKPTRPNQIYCNPSCTQKAKRKRLAKKYEGRPKKKYEKNCEICGEVFLTAEKRTRFCSRLCLNEHLRNLAREKKNERQTDM